jgi:hypothetical protein
MRRRGCSSIPPNVLAANHLQQAAEKILGAVRLHRGLLNTKDYELVIWIDGEIDSSAGGLSPSPGIEDLRAMLKLLLELHALAQGELRSTS